MSFFFAQSVLNWVTVTWTKAHPRFCYPYPQFHYLRFVTLVVSCTKPLNAKVLCAFPHGEL